MIRAGAHDMSAGVVCVVIWGNLWLDLLGDV